MRLFLFGASGNTGRRILSLALRRGHQVTAFVRDPISLLDKLGHRLPVGLAVVPGDIDTTQDLAAAIKGHDVVVNAAGYVTDGERFTRLVGKVIRQTTESLGSGGRLWQFGGAAALNIPGKDVMGVDLPLVPAVYEAHRTNFNALTKSSLDWSMLCPGPMIDAPNGEPTKGLRLSIDHWPVPLPGYADILPKAALSLVFKSIVPELTISYEDAADIILGNLGSNGPFSRKRVGVALPAGQRNFKTEAPG